MVLLTVLVWAFPVLASEPINEQIGDHCSALVCVNAPKTLKKASYKLFPAGNGQCVAFVQNNGYGHLNGNAIEWVRYTTTNIPIVGSVVVLNEGKYGHLALVTEVKEDTIVIWEQNYKGLYIVSSREIDISYNKIMGYVSN